MRRDPTQFRERFKRWKEGELVYDKGLPKFEDGKWNPNDTYTADAGMIKSKLAIASHFGNPTARRMTNYDGRDYTWSGEYEYINGVGEPKRGNVYVGSYDNLVTPLIQDNGKTLELVDDPWNPKNEQRSYKQSLKFNKMRDAWSFGENYKKYAPMMNLYEDGKMPKYGDGENPQDVKFYKSLVFDNSTRPEYETFVKAGFLEDDALKRVKYYYKLFPDNYSSYAGELPNVVVTPKQDSKSTVLLTTYYPWSTRYPVTGHSTLELIHPEVDGELVPSSGFVTAYSDDPWYNFITNNCSDATRKAIEYATQKRINPLLFTTPGDVKDFVEKEFGGKSKYDRRGYSETTFTIPTKLARKIVEYSTKQYKKRVQSRKK